MRREPLAIRGARESDRERVEAMLEAEDLASTFVPEEFCVAEADGDVVGCARLAPLPTGGFELASVAVRPDRRGEGIGTRLVERALACADGAVEALCLQPGFFAGLGFEPLDEVPEALEAKAEGSCREREFVPMVRRAER